MNSLREWLRENYQKLMDEPGTENDVAFGFAIGVLVSFTPFITLHVALTVLITFMIRKSIGSGIIGTLIFNPVTAPFIIALNVALGRLLMGESPMANPIKIDHSITGLTRLWEIGLDLFYPWLIGGMIIGPVAAVISFFMVRRSVVTYRRQVYLRMQRRKEKKRQKHESDAQHTQ